MFELPHSLLLTKIQCILKTVIPLLLPSLLFFLTGCTYDTLSPVPSCAEDLVLEVLDLTPSSCEAASGGFTINVINGDPQSSLIEFSLDGVSYQPNGVFDGLTAGSYTVQVRAGDCNAAIEVGVLNEQGLNASLQSTPSVCGSNSGTISVQIADAFGAVQLSLNEGPMQTETDFTGLAPGTYDVKVQDEAGCELALQVRVNSDADYEVIEAIINSSCALSGCHAGNQSPDFRVKENIINNANRIMSRTGNQSMPPNSSGITLTESQIDAIACWVADGAPE